MLPQHTKLTHHGARKGQRVTGTRLLRPHRGRLRDSLGNKTESYEAAAATEDLPESPRPDPAQPRTGLPDTSNKGRPRNALSRRAMIQPPTGSLPHPPPLSARSLLSAQVRALPPFSPPRLVRHP